MAQKGQFDTNLQKLLLALRQQKEEQAAARILCEQVKNTRPDPALWSGDISTEAGLIAMHRAFNTDQAEKELIAAHDPNDPGNSGDDIALSIQIDYAAQMERAFRARTTMTFPRMLAHVAGREKGHGMARGVIAYSLIDYVQRILLQAAESAEEDTLE